MLKYNRIETAKSVWNRTHKMMAIVAGNDGLFWLVTMAKAESLRKAGFVVIQ